MPHTLKSIVELLDRFHQRATYGAVAGVLGKVPRSVMQGHPRDWKHSWVVNEETGEPTEYPALKKHRALHERDEILSTREQLEVWLSDPR